MAVESVPKSSSPSEPAAPSVKRSGNIAGTISDEIVGLLRDRAGRGPTRARTAILPDLVVVTLSDCLTKAERTLVDNGDEHLAGRIRSAVFQAIRPHAIATVRDLTGRFVDAYMTDQHFDPDVAIVAFVLGAPTPSQAGEPGGPTATAVRGA